MGLGPEDRAGAGAPPQGATRTAQQQLLSVVQQLSPRQLSRPSRPATAAIISAVAGSAHHQPRAALSVSPTRSAAER